jgi:hypothetical protein
MVKRRTRRRPRRVHTDTCASVEFLQEDLLRMRERMDALARESAGHVRRCAEMQAEIDLLKTAMAALRGESRF